MKRIFCVFTAVLILISCCVFTTGTVFAADGDYTYKTVTGGVEITGYTGESGDITIPATLGGSAVVGIGEKAFYQNTNIKNVNISSGVEYIGNRAFAGSFITGVYMPDTVTTLDNSSFSSCIYLTDITLSKNIKTITNSCFYLCTRLESVVIPEGVEVIDDMAFQNCNHLTTVTLPSTLKSIGEYAFAYTGITELTIPTGTEEIGASAFFICDKLEKVVIPGTVKTIGEYAFCNCYALSSLSLGEGIEVIGTSAFDSCALTIVMIPTTVTEIGDYAFGYVFDEFAFDYVQIEMFQILCAEGSAGYEYASANGIPYLYYTITPPTEEPTEVPTNEPTEAPTTAPTDTPTTAPTQEPTEVPTTAPIDTPEYDKGDANMDGSINIKDATAIQKHIALLEVLSDEALLLADYDSDTQITIKDATAIQKFIAGIVA